MKKPNGFILSEYVTFVIIIAVAIAVGVGMFVGQQRDGMVQSARESLEAIEAKLAAAGKNGTFISCDNSMVSAEELANDYLSFSIKTLPVNVADLKEGYMAAVFIESEKETDASDTFDTARRLHKSLEKEEDFPLKTTKKEDDVIAFSIRFHDYPVCAG